MFALIVGNTVWVLANHFHDFHERCFVGTFKINLRPDGLRIDFVTPEIIL